MGSESCGGFNQPFKNTVGADPRVVLSDVPKDVLEVALCVSS
jgi:hypothetical protein